MLIITKARSREHDQETEADRMRVEISVNSAQILNDSVMFHFYKEGETESVRVMTMLKTDLKDVFSFLYV